MKKKNEKLKIRKGGGVIRCYALAVRSAALDSNRISRS